MNHSAKSLESENEMTMRFRFFRRAMNWAFCLVILNAPAMALTGCYTSREVMLRNPAHVRAAELLAPDPGAQQMMSAPDQLPDMPAGYHDSTFASVHADQPIVDPRRPIWRVTESNPNKIKTIFYESNKQLLPSGYAWQGDELQVMISRDYEFKTYSVKMERIDSLLAVYTHYDGRKTRNAILIGGSVGTLITVLMIGYTNYWFD
ncbi:MAG: hypothetical protein WBP29_12765 [Candidatus Zixiibacteriota bacterium]